MTPVRVLFVDHERRLSGGERDLVDLVRGIPAGAVEAHVALPGEGALADALRRVGATVHIFTIDERLRRLSRWELARRPHLVLRNIAALAVAGGSLVRVARAVRPDVIHTNTMKAHYLAVPAAVVLRRPLVWHVRDILQPGWLLRGFGWLGGFIPTSIVCISGAVREALVGTPAERRTRIVYNGVRPATAALADAATWRRRLGAGRDDILVGLVGQIAWWKGQDVFVDAAAKVAAGNPHCRFAIVGECLFPDNEAEFERATRERASELGLDERLTWTGAVEPVEPLMASLDVLVHASRLPEPFGRVIVEAMAAGVPVITTAIGAGPELVPPDAGCVVPPDDADALSAAIRAVAPDRRTAATYRDAARRAAASFDITVTGDGVLSVYSDVSTPDRRRRPHARSVGRK